MAGHKRQRMRLAQDVLASESAFWSRVKVQDGAARTEVECLAELRRLGEVAILHKLQVLAQVYRGEWRVQRCGARTKQPDQHPCRNLPEPGRTRCKYHGGLSTGPRTVEGRERIAEAQRRRWAEWRRNRNTDEEEEKDKSPWTVPEAQDALSISRATIYRYLRAGTLRAFRLPGGGQWRIPDAEMTRVMRLVRPRK